MIRFRMFLRAAPVGVWLIGWWVWNRSSSFFHCDAQSTATATTRSTRATSWKRGEPRYWPRYAGKRNVKVLDGLWNSSQLSLKEAANFDALDPTFDPSSIPTPNISYVPSTVDNVLPGYMGYRGVTFYRTHIPRAVGRLQFQACSFYCRVFVDNTEIGDHRAGGYVAFWLDVPQTIVQNTNRNEDFIELFVMVDNRFNATTAPMHTGGDFWHYGGIIRSVEWHDAPSKDQHNPHWPWRLYVSPQPDLESVSLVLHLMNTTYQGLIATEIKYWFDDPRDAASITRIVGGTLSTSSPGVVSLGVVPVPHPRLWSTQDPQLHTISISMNGAILQERFGLRYWDIDESTNSIRLNYQPIFLAGWNHHTQFPDTAASPTDDQLDIDIQLLRQGHANFVRGAHYPQDQRWLDRLDENGFVMWSETLGPNVSVANLQDSYFLRQQAQQVDEMVNAAMNHASIAFWAFFNEGPSHSKDACAGYQTSFQQIQKKDSTRFITYASNTYPPRDVCYDAATVISHNAYPGWYQKGPPAKWWNGIAADLAAGRPLNALGKPFLISETGAAGIYEWMNSTTNNTHTKWTIPYQTEIIREDVTTAIGNPNISGICLWHFFDFKVDDKWQVGNPHCDYLPNVSPPTCGYIKVNTSTAGGRPGGANHKGVLDFFRRPKPSYAIVGALYANVTSTTTAPIERNSYGISNANVGARGEDQGATQQ